MQVERLKEIFGLMGVAAKSRPCKGMAGLLAEGDEVMAKAEDQEDAAADRAADLVAVEAGKPDVEQNGVGTVGLGFGDRLG